MGLTGNMIATAFAGNPSVVNYTIFVTVFAMITLFYLIAITFKEEFTFHKFVPAAMDVLNVLFFFCAAVALAAELGAHSCSNSVRLNLSLTSLYLTLSRDTLFVTESRTAPTTVKADAEKLKPQPSSCGSLGHAFVPRCSSLFEAQVVPT